MPIASEPEISRLSTAEKVALIRRLFRGRTELLKQWQERLQAFLGVGKAVVGTIGAGKAKATGKIDIAVMQSLSRQERTGNSYSDPKFCSRSKLP